MQEIIYLQFLFKVNQFELDHMFMDKNVNLRNLFELDHTFMDKNVNLRNLLIQTEEFTKIKFSLRLEVQYLIVRI